MERDSWFLKISLIVLVVFVCSGCQVISFMDCGDRGVCRRTGFLWHHAVCVGDKECRQKEVTNGFIK